MRQAQKAQGEDKGRQAGQAGEDRQGARDSGSYRFKRIKEFVYDMHAVLGKGNFSTVYRGRNQETSKPGSMQMRK